MNWALSGFTAFVANMVGWTKRDKALAALEDAERRSYEYATTYWDESTPKTPPPTPSTPPALLTTLTLLLRLPRELRDQVYSHLLSPISPTYTIQPPFVYRSATYLPTTPLHFVPPSLRRFSAPTHPVHPSYPSYPTHPAARTVIAELTIYLLTTFVFFARYRYDSSLLPFLERDWMNRGVVPGQHLRRLSVMIRTPEGPEDRNGDDFHTEFEWGAMFPAARNARCRVLRKRLERDLLGLGRVVGEGCVVELLVWVGTWEDKRGKEEGEGQRAMRRWLEELAGRWRAMGKRMVVKLVSWDYETRELVFEGEG